MSKRKVRIHLQGQPGLGKVRFKFEGHEVQLEAPGTIELESHPGLSHLHFHAVGEPGTTFKIVLPNSTGRSSRTFQFTESGVSGGILEVHTPETGEVWPGPRFRGRAAPLGTDWPGPRREA